MANNHGEGAPPEVNKPPIGTAVPVAEADQQVTTHPLPLHGQVGRKLTFQLLEDLGGIHGVACAGAGESTLFYNRY